MFSGIRYILGYADETPSEASSASGAGSPTGTQSAVTSSAASVLEQTLNAATTKFTEQLLPQQASIEQLQSSSHQLLPSITEQHEENESKKQQLSIDEGVEAIHLEVNTSPATAAAAADDDDEDDSLVADSWELLDLVEKVSVEGLVAGRKQGQQGTSVQKDENLPNGLYKSTSGILKQSTSASASASSSSASSLSSSSANDTKSSTSGSQQSRQKPKVSFETPDLVRSKQEIEKTKPKEASQAVASLTRKTKGSRSNKRNAKLGATATETVKSKETDQPQAASSKVDVSVGKLDLDATKEKKSSKSEKRNKKQGTKLKEVNPSLIVGTKTAEVCASFEPVIVANPKPITAHTLNYARALSAKRNSDVAKKEEKVEKVELQRTATNGDEGAKGNTTNNDGEESNRPMKRNRPTSTSSWSSSDEIDRVQNEWETWVKPEVEAQAQGESSDAVVAANDNEDDVISLTSSGFSDCEYGFGGINDYVMRPKKTGAKRNRTQSGSSGSFRAPKVGRGHSTKHASSSNAAESSSAKSGEEYGKKVATKTTSVSGSSSSVATSTKNSKPKKKRLILTGSTANKTSSKIDFLKPHAVAQGKVGNFLELKSVKQQSPVSSSNDSSEIPDMDESWYVTPPPCFTGAIKQTTAGKNEQQQPKSKEAARENALIEHPSIYIASSSKGTKDERAPRACKPMDLPKNILVKKATVKKAAAPMESVPQLAALEKLEDAAWQSDDDDAFDDDQFACAKPILKPITAEQSSSAAPKPISCSVIKFKSTKKDSSAEKKVAAAAAPKIGPAPAVSAKAKVRVVSVKPIEKKAWKNKFIVDAWDLDEQEGVDSDFDSMFEPVKKKKKSKAKKQQRLKKVERGTTDLLPLDLNTDSDEFLQEAIEIIMESHPDASNSVELISIRSLSMENSMNAENDANLFNNIEEASVETANKLEKRRQTVQVRPIEPERRPAWQLKKLRSKRRPLVNSAVDNKQQSGRKTSKGPSNRRTKNDSTIPTTSSGSSSKSTPTLIDRIGSSIVANLTNLTNGLVSSGALNACSPVGHSSPLVEGSEKMDQTVASKTSVNHAINLGTRKQLSRGSLKRQNVTAQQANMQRRPDRRLKMFANPNGSSVNRKVHANIH